MPRILEFKEIDGEYWANVGKLDDRSPSFYIWTVEEAKKKKKEVIIDFVLDLVNEYMDKL